MGLSTFLYLLIAGNQLVEGHNTFVRVARNGVWAQPFQFIRNKTEPFEELATPFSSENTRWYHTPTYPDTDYPNSSRCGRDNMAHAASTEVMQVKAGDKFEFVVTSAPPENNGWFPPNTYWENCPEGRGICREDDLDGWYNRVYHQGPFVASLSEVPAGLDVREYDGSGEWVKIHTLGLKPRENWDSPVSWLPHNDSATTGTPPRLYLRLPKQTPAGQYLLRLDAPWPGSFVKYDGEEEEKIYKHVQTYAACVQIEVESEFTGSLPKGIHIPEDYLTAAPGLHMSLNQSGHLTSLDGEYVYPGGPLWDGETLVQDKPSQLF